MLGHCKNNQPDSNSKQSNQIRAQCVCSGIWWWLDVYSLCCVFLCCSVTYEDPQAVKGLASALDVRKQNAGGVGHCLALLPSAAGLPGQCFTELRATMLLSRHLGLS